MKNLLLILLLSLTTLSANAQSERDKKFVACMARTGLLEIKISELAETNGLAIEVKDMAKHMMEDHSKANSDLKLLADRKNISFPTTLNSGNKNCTIKWPD
jgi:putative membrane protein